MSQYGWKGVSFPFRLSNKGGTTMSTADYYNPLHIEESIVQILTTRKGERPMNPNFGSKVDYSIFSPNDKAIQNLLRYEIKKELQEQEPRITVNDDDITFIDNSQGNLLKINISYVVNDYNNSYNVEVEL